MRVLILGAGHMGQWLAEALKHHHSVAVNDLDGEKVKELDVHKISDPFQVKEFEPDLVINAVTLTNIYKAFDEFLPYVPQDCILSDIASVKSGLYEYYLKSGKRFVSTHPMFGPAFTKFHDLRGENAIIIKESEEEGKEFFRDFYSRMKLNLYECTFEEHDKSVSYTLSVPFLSSMMFAVGAGRQEAPGNSYKRHLETARAIFSNDDSLLAEVMFNPHSVERMAEINSQLAYLTHIIKERDFHEMQKLINRMRKSIQ